MRKSTTGWMGTPEIVMPRDGKWASLAGHRCVTVEEAEAYCAEIGGGSFKVVYDGEALPPCPPAPPPPPPAPPISEETRLLIQGMWDKIKARA